MGQSPSTGTVQQHNNALTLAQSENRFFLRPLSDSTPLILTLKMQMVWYAENTLYLSLSFYFVRGRLAVLTFSLLCQSESLLDEQEKHPNCGRGQKDMKQHKENGQEESAVHVHQLNPRTYMRSQRGGFNRLRMRTSHFSHLLLHSPSYFYILFILQRFMRN